MLVELVKTTTSDGLRLDGAFYSPPDSSSPSKSTSTSKLKVDATIFLHGVGGNFYSGVMQTRFAEKAMEHGAATLVANTRGRDGLYTASTLRGTRRYGAAYEIVDECRDDVSAWLDFLVDRGYSRIALIGHSLGAIKAVYSQAHQPHSACQCVVAVSPPRLSYSAFVQGEKGPEFSSAMEQAQHDAAEGRGDKLMEAAFPFPLLITCAAYVDKYGPAERYNILRFANQVGRRTLFVYGSVELEKGGIAFADMPEALAELPNQKPPFEIITMSGANHFYSGLYDELGSEIIEWLRR